MTSKRRMENSLQWRVRELIHWYIFRFPKRSFFFDADDVAEVKWVIALDKKLKGQDKLILVKGSLLTQEKIFTKPIYFDQAGHLTTHFGITRVPALVQQHGLQLKISEIAP